MATKQLKTYYAIQNDLLQHPQKSLSVLADYLRDQPLADVTETIEDFRSKGQRKVGSTHLIKFQTGQVVFGKAAPQARVELQVCYDRGKSHFVDSQGHAIPDRPGVVRVGFARFALFADAWPSDEPSDWRIGRQEVQGLPCDL